MPGRLDIVDHVADEDRLRGVEVVVGEQVEQDLPFVERLGIDLLEIGLPAEPSALRLEVLVVNGAEQEGGQAAVAEIIEKIEGMRQRRDAGLEELERGVDNYGRALAGPTRGRYSR